MKNIMIDLETLDHRKTAAIVSIGAIYFDENGVGEKFYQNITIDSCIRSGLTVGGETLKWWFSQSDYARKSLFEETTPLNLALASFSNYVKGPVKVWGNGSDFDIAILQNAYNRLNMPLPWKPYDGRCFRTVCNLTGIKKKHSMTSHNALDDAIQQATHLIKIIKTVPGLTL